MPLRKPIYTLTCVIQIASGELLYNRELRSVLSDDLKGWDGGQGGRLQREGICIHMADSQCYTAEIKTL